jgi:hypothetical protein
MEIKKEEDIIEDGWYIEIDDYENHEYRFVPFCSIKKDKKWVSIESLIEKLKEPITDNNLFNEEVKIALIKYKNDLIKQLTNA